IMMVLALVHALKAARRPAGDQLERASDLNSVSNDHTAGLSRMLRLEAMNLRGGQPTQREQFRHILQQIAVATGQQDIMVLLAVADIAVGIEIATQEGQFLR